MIHELTVQWFKKFFWQKRSFKLSWPCCHIRLLIYGSCCFCIKLRHVVLTSSFLIIIIIIIGVS